MKFKVCGVTICPQRSGGEEQRSTVPCWPVWYPHNIFKIKPLLQKEYFRADDGSISDKVCYTIIYNCFYT